MAKLLAPATLLWGFLFALLLVVLSAHDHTFLKFLFVAALLGGLFGVWNAEQQRKKKLPPANPSEPK